MKKISVYILSLLLIIAISVIAQDSYFKPCKAIVTGTTPTVRHIPSAGGNVIATLKMGDVVNIIEKSKNISEVDGVKDYWYKVELSNNSAGWVYGQFISFDINSNTEIKWNTVLQDENQKFTSIEITKSGKIVIGSESGHLFSSSDDGQNFTKMLPQAPGISIGRINSTLTIKNTIWIAASGDLNGGLWKSTNDGNTWLHISTSQGLISNDVNDIVEMNGILYIATNKGLCSTKNDGKSFILERNLDMKINKLIITDNIIIAGTSKGLYVGKDNRWLLGRDAKVWERYNSKTYNMGSNVYTIAISPKDDIYIGTDKGMAKSSLLKLSRWTSVGSKIEVNSVFVDKSDRLLVATDNGLSISRDQGRFWVTYKEEHGLASDKVYRVLVSPVSGIIWAVSSDSGLSYSE